MFDFNTIDLQETADDYSILGIIRHMLHDYAIEHVMELKKYSPDINVDKIVAGKIGKVTLNEPLSETLSKIDFSKQSLLSIDLTHPDNSESLTLDEILMIFEKLRVFNPGGLSLNNIVIELRDMDGTISQNNTYTQFRKIFDGGYISPGDGESLFYTVNGISGLECFADEPFYTDFNINPKDIIDYLFCMSNIYETEHDRRFSSNPSGKLISEIRRRLCNSFAFKWSDSSKYITLSEKGKENFLSFLEWSEKCTGAAIFMEYRLFKHLVLQLPEKTRLYDNRDMFLKLFTLYAIKESSNTSVKELMSDKNYCPVKIGAVLKKTREALRKIK